MMQIYNKYKDIQVRLKYPVRVLLPALLVCAWVALMSVDYFEERRLSRQQYLQAQQSLVEAYLHRYQRELQASIAQEDVDRIRWVIDGVSRAPGVSQVLVADDSSVVRFANQSVWEGNIIADVAHGFSPQVAQMVTLDGVFQMEANHSRNSLQIYFNLPQSSGLEGRLSLMYVEYDLSQGANLAGAAAMQRWLRQVTTSGLVLLVILMVWRWQVVRPLKQVMGLAASHSNPSQKLPQCASEFGLLAQRIQGLWLRHQQDQADLAAIDDRWRFLLDNEGLAVMDWLVDKDQLSLSPGCYRMLGVNELELAPHMSSWLKRLPEDESQQLQTQLEQLNQAGLDQLELHYPVRHKHGHLVTVSQRSQVVERHPDGKAKRVQAVLMDISPALKARDALSHQAKHDALTNLSNRASFLELLDAQARRLLKPEHKAGLLLIDIDNFTAWNQALGHKYGDELLLKIAARLAAEFPDWPLARMSGDEFGLLVTRFNSDSANTELENVAERVRQLLSDEFEYGSAELHLSVSIGGRLIDGSRERLASDWLRHAETALSRAKAKGRDQFVLYRPGDETYQGEQHWLLSQLRLALQRGELSVHYQPIYDRHQSLVALEALLRWHHPVHGDISPSQFIPLAEQSGLINQLGEFVIDSACRLLNQLSEAELPTPLMSINVGARQLDMDDFAQRTLRLLQQHKIAPKQIQLELTEYVLLQDNQLLAPRLSELVDAGVVIAVDDFGTGYSALSYLTELPIDKLKIDASFVQRLGKEPQAEALLKSVVDLGHNLSFELVAEGVSQPQQLQALQRFGCDYFQGFLLQKPMAESELVALLSRQPAADALHSEL
ncbi:putative bifunctional diguanylate cyclase/phosphodiesterase [Paraferrimonas sedimenticola]|uniref:Diguanylate cyclase (GGDEF) domain-containing protein n=1 Tax=Paraferrimonas sedimenticola TaxID=375674 RepID=A0AA37RYT4_9GAMM|nr:EAL domain-containing protein [Paraferrimonas sedimenticola]GLP97804.1 hypothetical protein GCM10007895_31110 [Paraferrimonas sedimenticola]